jgi:hypothetical protein
MSVKNCAKLLLMLLLIFCLTNSYAQVFSDKVMGESNQELIDSLKNAEYPYALPIWGQEATNAGFHLPYSAGISVNYLWQESGIVINNLSIGFNNSPMQSIDQLVRFNNTTARSNILNIRPDIWLFPFLNIYGIFAVSKTSTEVEFGIWLPDNIGDPEGSEWSEIIRTNTTAEFDGMSFGFGLTPTIGIAGGWFALDMNFTWTDIDALKEPAFGFVFGPRLGKTFRFNKPDMNINFWIGGFRLKIGSQTEGSLPLSDLFDVDEFAGKIEAGFERVAQAQQNADNWWNSLTPIEQKNPNNIAKYQAANRVIEGAANILNAASGAAGNIENATVQYSLEKKQECMWNFIVGTQFQLNKHWMFRIEYGFLSARHQFLGGIQYRFGL